jgi:hypothetical protein
VDNAGQESEPSGIMIFDITLGMPDVAVDQNLVVFPNPASGHVNFSLKNAHAAKTNLSVFDAQGKLVETLFDGMLQPGAHHFIWNSPVDKTGVYFMRLSSGENTTTRKLLIMD